MKLEVKVEKRYGCDAAPVGFKALIEWLEEKLSLIPPEHQASARVQVHAYERSYSDELYAEYEISYTRLETDTEEAARLRRIANELEDQEINERREFARLQAKYNPQSKGE